MPREHPVIRPATEHDMPQITAVRTSVVENHLSVEQLAARGITPAGMIEQMRGGELGCWVAEEDGSVVAFSMAHKNTGNLFALFTMPGHENCGYGSELLRAAEVWLRLAGCREITLDTDKDSHATEFYARRGYVVRKATDTDLFMWKAL